MFAAALCHESYLFENVKISCALQFISNNRFIRCCSQSSIDHHLDGINSRSEVRFTLISSIHFFFPRVRAIFSQTSLGLNRLTIITPLKSVSYSCSSFGAAHNMIKHSVSDFFTGCKMKFLIVFAILCFLYLGTVQVMVISPGDNFTLAFLPCPRKPL